MPMMQTFGVLALVWFTAYFGPYMAVIVNINEYGEAIPELIMWFIITPVCVYGAYLNLKDIFGLDLMIRRRYKYLKDEWL